MTRCRECQPLPEEVARAAELLGRRWVLAILWASSEAGAVRFNEFRQTLETIPPRTLAARLVELESAGILDRRVLHTRPPLVEYRLTELGLRLGALVEAMNVWASVGSLSRYTAPRWRRTRSGRSCS